MENQLDALHPSVTHQSTGVAASKVERALKAEGKDPPLYYHYLSTFASSFDQWDSVQTVNFPRGHGILKGYMGLRPEDPDTQQYTEAMYRGLRRRTRGTISRPQHPSRADLPLSVGAVARCSSCAAFGPLSPDKTLSEIWHFRLKGVSPAIYRRSLWYFNLVNSPATMINADDLENWTKGQWGLQSKGGEWVSFHRNFGGDTRDGDITYSNNGTSEVVMRSQFAGLVQIHVGQRRDGT